MQFGQVHHIEYYVKDLKASNLFWDWFMPMMDYEPYQKWSEGLSWRHPLGTYLVFVQVVPEALDFKNNRHGHGLNHIAFQGKDRAHFDELVAGLKERNIKILTLKEKFVCFEDPNEFAVEVYCP